MTERNIAHEATAASHRLNQVLLEAHEAGYEVEMCLTHWEGTAGERLCPAAQVALRKREAA